MHAAQKGHADVVRLLVKNGADIGSKRTDGTTALMDAIGSGNVPTIKLLLANGAAANGARSGMILESTQLRPLKLTSIVHAMRLGQLREVKNASGQWSERQQACDN